MLYFEGRKGRKKDSASLIAKTCLAFLLLVVGCGDSSPLRTKKELSVNSFKEIEVQSYTLDSVVVRRNLEFFCKLDHDNDYVSKLIRQYYSNYERLVWVDYAGVDERADSVLVVLSRKLPEMGFNTSYFNLAQIAEDINNLRELKFDNSGNLNRIVARLEYNLSKAYVRYVSGQRFGFVNPSYVLNRYDARETDSTGRVITYRNLYDVDIKRPGNQFVSEALSHATTDSLCLFLHQSEPTMPLYCRLIEMLRKADNSQHKKILVNMERCRWREKMIPNSKQKYVIVNVPAYHLWAVAPDTIVDMRAACGALKTKTPLLSSQISYMQVNPEWVIPMSIIRDDVARYGGDTSYFTRHRYYIADRKTGKRLSPAVVTPQMLNSGNYKVAQEGGAGNSLGRIIFRFPNNFSVFLHDTSSPGVFQRDNRGVSHGCVRVQRPFDLALFMLGKDADPQLVDKLRISMGIKPETQWGLDMVDGLDHSQRTPRLINFINVSPHVPIFITYYTLFLTPDGSIQHYPDVYGYDEAIAKALSNYIE